MNLLNILNAIFVLLISSQIVFGQEVIADFKEDSVPILNEELRKITSDISSLESTYLTLTDFHFTRDASGEDFDLAGTPLVTDGTWQELNLSSIVGTGIRLVLLEGYITDDAASSVFAMRKNGNSNQYTILTSTTQVAGVANYYEGWVLTDSSGIIEYIASNTTWTQITIRVKGWIILD